MQPALMVSSRLFEQLLQIKVSAEPRTWTVLQSVCENRPEPILSNGVSFREYDLNERSVIGASVDTAPKMSQNGLVADQFTHLVDRMVHAVLTVVARLQISY